MRSWPRSCSGSGRAGTCPRGWGTCCSWAPGAAGRSDRGPEDENDEDGTVSDGTPGERGAGARWARASRARRVSGQGAGAVERYRGPEYRRLLAAARRSLERTGGALTGRISVADPDDAERKAIIGITGVHQPAGTRRLTVSLPAPSMRRFPGDRPTGWCRTADGSWVARCGSARGCGLARGFTGGVDRPGRGEPALSGL